jgi:hypothetical protein
MGLFDIFKKKPKEVDNNYVFDKAKYHDGTIEKLGLDEEQSFVHTGMFFAWLVNNGLMSDFFINETNLGLIENLKERKISPSQIYMDWDGVLIGELLNEEGFNFALDYFDFDKGKYMKDYEKTFNVTDNKVFEVKNTWDNYDKLRSVIDSAYKKWKK